MKVGFVVGIRAVFFCIVLFSFFRNCFQISENLNPENNISSFYFFRENISNFNNSLKAEKILKENIPESLKSRYVGINGAIRMEIIPFENLNNQRNKKEFVEYVYKNAPNVSGGAFTTYEAGKTIISSFKEAMTISIFLTTLFLFITLRNLRKVFIVFINLIAALLFSLSFLSLFGLNLNFQKAICYISSNR